MKILLTGVTGYVGQSIMGYLQSRGFEVHGIVRRAVDCSDQELHYHLLEKNNENIRQIVLDVKPDVVIHIASLFLASHTFENIEGLIQSNVTFPTQLLEAMSLAGVRKFINTGTSWQHYESSNYNPVNLYAATKQAFEDIIKYYTEAKHFSCITLKIFDSYGPNDQRRKLISLLDTLSKTQESLDMSPGEQEINLVHISDICKAFEIAIQLIQQLAPSFYQDYGLMSEQSMSLKELAKLYERENECSLNINWGGRDYREREVMIPATNLTKLSGWKADYPLLVGLKKKNRNV
ncbi:NAD-dependent epimerase/dehydratase family protein [Aeromonas salmonicida]|uniref:NAD-dependent epimerase/dehydratase family protein n=1 Tax=Aeromonas salmonicida TaxID=645 RepID=UPI0035A5BA8C